MEVSILDIKSGNMGSLKNILKFIDLKFEIIEDKEKIKNASSLIIPGDGSFNVLDYIKKKDFIDELNSFFLRKKPILGICLGMQLFSNSSEEGKDKEGFGWISGKVRKFSNKLNASFLYSTKGSLWPYDLKPITCLSCSKYCICIFQF